MIHIWHGIYKKLNTKRWLLEDLTSDPLVLFKVIEGLTAETAFHRQKLEKRIYDLLTKEHAIQLCGPVGSGKTQLAFTIARQKQYNAVFINCSGRIRVTPILDDIGAPAFDKNSCIILDACEELGAKRAMSIAKKMEGHVIVTTTKYLDGIKAINVNPLTKVEQRELVARLFPSFDMASFETYFSEDARQTIIAIRNQVPPYKHGEKRIKPLELAYLAVDGSITAGDIERCPYWHKTFRILAANAERLWEGADLSVAMKLLSDYNATPYPEPGCVKSLLLLFPKSYMMPVMEDVRDPAKKSKPKAMEEEKPIIKRHKKAKKVSKQLKLGGMMSL